MRELSKRGNLVLGVAIGLALAGIVWISGNLWWVDSGWCIGSMVECYSK
jgi:hypothetical protein